MLTTESGLNKKTEGKNAGVTGWIVKPFKPDRLLNTIKKLLSLHAVGKCAPKASRQSLLGKKLLA
jgi:DNA-binding response OmpR family regulator